MSLKNRIRDEWNRLSNVTNSGATLQTMNLDVPGGRIECQFTAINALACSFEHLTMHAPHLANSPLAELDRIAATLSQRLSYLLESISPVEKDQDQCIVQMRSNPPRQDDDGTSYYELVVRRGELSLRRYSKLGGQSRRVIPAHVTSEVFTRLAEDFATLMIQ